MRGYLFAFVVGCLLAAAAAAWGQCGPRGWGPALMAPRSAVPSGYEWRRRADTADEVYLFRDGVQVGGYSYSTGFYRQYRNGQWSPPAVAPVSPPFGDRGGHREENLFGLDVSALPAGEKIWSANEVFSHGEALELFAEDVDDISSQPHITVVERDAAKRKRIKEEIEVAQAAGTLPKSLRVQIYDPGKQPSAHMLKPFALDRDQRFQQTGTVIYAQAADKDGDGIEKVAAEYGRATLEAVIDALRKVDPNWDPNKQPLPALPALHTVPVQYWIGGAVIFLLFIGALKRRPA